MYIIRTATMPTPTTARLILSYCSLTVMTLPTQNGVNDNDLSTQELDTRKHALSEVEGCHVQFGTTREAGDYLPDQNWAATPD